MSAAARELGKSEGYAQAVDDMKDALANAFHAGATAVHAAYFATVDFQPAPEFGEASSDYATKAIAALKENRRD